jgi:glutamyl-tRNA reductase
LAFAHGGKPVCEGLPDRRFGSAAIVTELVLCGLNYHSVPVAIRERFTIPESCLKHALDALKRLPHILEAAVVSTCNRTEVYAVVTDIQSGWDEIESFFSSAQAVLDHGALQPNFRLLRDDVALHLLRVAAGLDSMVLGEGQILHQVKAAHQAALAAGSAGATIDSLFKFALSCGKKVRSQTSMGRRAVSMSSAAVELAKELLGTIHNQNVLVIGAGKMGQICLKLLLNDSNAGEISVANRTYGKIQSFLTNNISNLDRLKIVEDFEDRHRFAARADGVIVCSSAPEFVLKADLLSMQRRKSSSLPLFIIDLAVPRNVDPQIANMDGVSLYNADDLSKVVNRNLAERESLVHEADKIVFQVLKDFQNWQRNLLVAPTITDLRQKIETIRLEQMEKSCSTARTNGSGRHAQELEEISRAIVNQILHHPTTQLKASSDYEILRQQAEALRTLFNLDPLASDSKKPKTKRKIAPVKH